MFHYHTFKDLGIPGIYDHEPLLPKYHFPPDEFFFEKRVLDIGCASGFFTKYFAERGAIVTAVDINVDMMRMIKDKANLSRVEILEKDLYDLSYKSEFDLVLCGSLLMHVFYPMLLLNVVYKSLKPNGTFVLCTGGINNSDPVMIVEKSLGRERGWMETEVRSANESLWWLSPTAGVNMLQTIGFRTSTHMDTFMLTSTAYGVEIGHDYSSLHHVWHAVK